MNPKRDGTTVKYEVLARYDLWNRDYQLVASRASLEECHEWLEEHQLVPVVMKAGLTRDARINYYRIVRETVIRETVEREKVEHNDE